MNVSALHSMPSTKVKGAAMKKVKVAWWQKVSHKHKERAQPSQTHVLTNPPCVVIKGILKKINSKCIFDNSLF